MTDAPISDAELLAKLLDDLISIIEDTAAIWSNGIGGLPSGASVGDWLTNDLAPELQFSPDALSLIAQFRAAVRREERERCAKHLEWVADLLTYQDDADRLRSAATSVRALPTTEHENV